MPLREFFARSEELSRIPAALRERMAQVASVRTLRRNNVLWRAGETACSLTLVKTGLVKLVRPTPRGRSTICGLFGPPNSVGALSLLRHTEHRVDALVATPTATIASIPGDVVAAALEATPSFGVALACSVHRELSALHEKVDVLSAGSVESRLATLLVQLVEQFGDEMADHTTCIPLALSRRELADLVSTSFETAIRAMTSWDRAGIVETTPRGFVIRDLRALEEIAGGEPRIHVA